MANEEMPSLSTSPESTERTAERALPLYWPGALRKEEEEESQETVEETMDDNEGEVGQEKSFEVTSSRKAAQVTHISVRERQGKAMALCDKGEEKENQVPNAYDRKRDYVQMWVESDSKFSVTGRMRDPNTLTPEPEALAQRELDPVREDLGRSLVDKVQVTCEDVILKTSDMLTDLEGGAIKNIESAARLLEEIETNTQEDTARRQREALAQKDEIERLSEENKYLQSELVSARAALDRIYSSVVKTKDGKEVTPETMVMKTIKRVRHLETTKKDCLGQLKGVEEERKVLQAKSENTRSELKHARSSEVKLRNTVNSQKARMESYKQTIKELDENKKHLEERVRTLETTQNTLAEEKAGMVQEVKECKIESKENTVKLEQMQSFLRTAQKKRSLAEKALETAENQIQALSAKVLDQAVHVSEIARVKEVMEKEKELLKEGFDEALLNEEKAREELEQVTHESSVKCYRVHELRAALAEMKTKCDSQEAEHLQLQEENGKLQSDLDQSEAKVSELEQNVSHLTKKGQAFASLIPMQIESMTSGLGRLYTDLEHRLEAKDRKLSKVCSKFAQSLAKYKERMSTNERFQERIQSQLVANLKLLGERTALPASTPGMSAFEKQSGLNENILGYLDSLNLHIRDHMAKNNDLTNASQCLETNMILAQDEIQTLNSSLQDKDEKIAESEEKVADLVKECSGLKGKAAEYHAIVENLKEAIHKRSCISLVFPKGNSAEQNACNELMIAVKILLEELQKGAWDRECLEQELNAKKECNARLQYKVASYSTALHFNSKKLESSSELSMAQTRGYESKQRKILTQNAQLFSKLKVKEKRLLLLTENLDKIASGSGHQSEALQEVGQSTEVQLYKIISSLRCLDDIERNILGSFESFKENLSSKESEMEDILGQLTTHISKSKEVERQNLSLSEMLRASRRSQQSWMKKYQYINKMIGLYLPKIKLKLRRSKLAKLQVAATRRRNKHLCKQLHLMKTTEIGKLQIVRDKIASAVKDELLVRQSHRSALHAGRLWKVVCKSKKKLNEIEASLQSESALKRLAEANLDTMTEENSRLKCSLEKQSEMLAHLYELESFLVRSKETIQNLQNSDKQKGGLIEELRLSNTRIEKEKLSCQEKARLLEANLLRSQEELAVIQNQFAVTTKEHLRLIEKYSQLQSNFKSLKEDAKLVEDLVQVERNTHSKQTEEYETLRKELVAKEHRLRELRNALSSICAERDEAEAELLRFRNQDQVEGKDAGGSPERPTCDAEMQTDDLSEGPPEGLSQSVALQTEGELSSLQNEDLEAQAEILLLQSEVGKLKSVLAKAEKSDLEKQHGLVSLQEKVTTLEREVGIKENSLTHLQGILDNALESLAESTQEMLEVSGEEKNTEEVDSLSASNQLRAVEGVIATWRDACHKRDEQIDTLRSKLEVFACHFSEIEQQSEFIKEKSEGQAQAIQQKLKESYSSLRTLQQELEKHKRRLAKVHSSNQKSFKILNKALSGFNQAPLPDDLEEASKDTSSLICKLSEEIKIARQKQAKSKSSAKDNSEIAASYKVKSIALEESLEVKERRIRDLRNEVSVLEDKSRTLEGKQTLIDSYQSRLHKTEFDLSSANSKIEKQSKDLKELNKMLKAWEAMRICKDSQISALLEKCKQYEEQVAEKSRSVEALRCKIAARTAMKPQDAGGILEDNNNNSALHTKVIHSPKNGLTKDQRRIFGVVLDKENL